MGTPLSPKYTLYYICIYSHIATLEPKYILKSYMDPLGIFPDGVSFDRDFSRGCRPQGAVSWLRAEGRPSPSPLSLLLGCC